MATTTPNFGWAVPTSTDLVKDGAVAIETLGDSIDASLVDLKGGTTGQVLAKASGTDMDFSWVARYPNSVSTFLYKAAVQSIPNATWTAVTFSDENWDTNSFHSTSTNTSRITIPAGLAGKYQFNSRGYFDSNATGVRYVAIYKNGSSISVNYFGAYANNGFVSMTTLAEAAVGDYFEVYVFQNSGGNLNYNAGTSFGTTEGEFSAEYLGA